MGEKMLKKEITFVYMDSAEKAIMEPLANEAKKRGYSVELTNDKFKKCEIGVYCQHVNFPQFSNFSVIMLHDIIQQYGNWPDIWMREPWNKYDVGILPSNQWVSNWNECSQWYYARPRKGIYKVGWPKADSVANLDKDEYRKDFCDKYNLDPNKKTVLYAPAWENDNKQDDFVKAVRDLDVNIIIKQYPATPDLFPEMYLAIQEMYELHKDDPRVTILDPKTNIFSAILACDVLVSEESSTMAEALMMGIPSISVSNWLIPDTTPSRFPECNYEFVTMTEKENLKESVNSVICNYSKYKTEAEQWRDKLFCNIGKSSEMIIDIIDAYVENKEVKYCSLEPQKYKKMGLRQYLMHLKIMIHRETYYNYVQRSGFVRGIWNLLKKIKKVLTKK